MNLQRWIRKCGQIFYPTYIVILMQNNTGQRACPCRTAGYFSWCYIPKKEIIWDLSAIKTSLQLQKMCGSLVRGSWEKFDASGIVTMSMRFSCMQLCAAGQVEMYTCLSGLGRFGLIFNICRMFWCPRSLWSSYLLHIKAVEFLIQ